MESDLLRYPHSTPHDNYALHSQDNTFSIKKSHPETTVSPNFNISQNNDTVKYPIKATKWLKCNNWGNNTIQRKHSVNFAEADEIIKNKMTPEVTRLCATHRSCSSLDVKFEAQKSNPLSSSTFTDQNLHPKSGRSAHTLNFQTQRSIRAPDFKQPVIKCYMQQAEQPQGNQPPVLEQEPPVLESKRRSSSPPVRPSWGCHTEFVLACLGYAVGLGNVWRFPYLCYRNGGGAFLFPFFLMLIFIGLPIFYLELYIGQYTGLGPLEAFSSIAPFFSGLGYCTLVVITIIQIYYMVIVAWTLFYTIVSIGGQLGWGLCDNAYNTQFCYSGEYDLACKLNNTGGPDDLTYYLKRCISIGEICTSLGYQPLDNQYCMDGTQRIPWYANVTRTMAAEEYYNQRVLGLGDATWENWGSIQWHIVGTLFMSWLIAFFCVIRGVQSAGKVVYFTALFPYVMLTALMLRGVTLPGAREGILFYLSPKWSTLLEARVWGDAASQIFYSFGVACGSLITLASYNNFYNNCHFDACFVSIANFGTSIYAGFAIFSVLGFQAQQMGVSVDDVAQQGPGLAFVAYPEALLQMPVPQLWSILFFFMLFILGLGSQFAGIEAVNTAITDRWPHLRSHYWKVTAFTCFLCFILGIPMCYSGGVYLFTLLDWNTASWAVLVIGMAECASVSWCYGLNRAVKDLESMGMTFNYVSRFYWLMVWSVIVPFGSVGILVFIFSDWKTPEYANYVFPPFAEILGWAVGLSTLILFPIGMVWAYCHGYRGKQLFKPTKRWKAARGNRPINLDLRPSIVIPLHPS